MPVRISPINLLPEEKFRRLVASSTSTNQVIRYFGFGYNGGNRNTVQARIKALGISKNHFVGSSTVLRLRFEAKNLAEVMTKNSTYSRSALKRRLLKGGILKNECSICGLKEAWNGKPIVMRLDHENGIRDDNRQENLRMVCPNCDSQLETFGSRNCHRTRKRILRLCQSCGVEVDRQAKNDLCKKCYSVTTRKINWPSLEDLKVMVSNRGFSKAGRLLGVSDNAIRAHIKRCQRCGDCSSEEERSFVAREVEIS